ncbi:ATP-binding protein [Acidisoma cellulosilyticum]|uniref:ATP-binding protein n=1 Tax=Acidisoma cellulosilyticum TaxID=2802395 RepID=UPI001D0BA239|nr:hypothetical protein [Acidisoma cellulosilyticum]
MAAVVAQLASRRFVTLLGPGGIGKTAVALAVAGAVTSVYPDGIFFVDLAVLDDPGRVPAAVGVSLGISTFADDPTPGVLAKLANRRALIILDNCERVIDGTNVLAEQLLRCSSGLHILATSRERLRAEGEWVLNLPSLAMPPLKSNMTAAEAISYPAVQLFVERATAVNSAFRLVDEDAPVIADLCSRLDGIALAIELAAGHAGTFDLRTLLSLVENRFKLLSRGRRTAVPRHQTMRSVLDWSYALTSDQDRMVLRRLAVFKGAITLSAARKIVADGILDDDTLLASLTNLVDKSLVATEVSSLGIHYRLLDTTRDYAIERLTESGELEALFLRHAHYYIAILLDAEANWTTTPSAVWVTTFSREMGNIRSSLDWAFSESGDTQLAIKLASAAAPMLFDLSMVQESRRRASQALDALAEQQVVDEPVSMRLLTTLGSAMMYTPGPIPKTVEVWERVVSLSRALSETRFEARALWGLWTSAIYGGRPREAYSIGVRYRNLALRIRDEDKRRQSDRLLGVGLHMAGKQRSALRRLERMATTYDHENLRWHTVGFQVDQGLMVRATLARVLWLVGLPDRAKQLTEQSLKSAVVQGQVITLCYFLAEAAIPVACFAGEWEAARSALALLQETSSQGGLATWQQVANGAEIAIAAMEGATVAPSQFAEVVSAALRTGHGAHIPWISCLMAQAALNAGESVTGINLVETALQHCDRTGDQWCRPELLRLKGMLLEMAQPDSLAATACLDEALTTARRQQALAWELRIVTSQETACLRRGTQPHPAGGLRSVFERFTEGFGTADLRAAQHLLGHSNSTQPPLPVSTAQT